MYIYHSFLSIFSILGHLGCFHVLTIVSNVAINIQYRCLLDNGSLLMCCQKKEKCFKVISKIPLLGSAGLDFQNRSVTWYWQLIRVFPGLQTSMINVVSPHDLRVPLHIKSVFLKGTPQEQMRHISHMVL